MFKLYNEKMRRDFFVLIQNREIYIGTPAELSRVAAQLLVHEAMKPTGLKANGSYMPMPGNTIAVGYKIPLFRSTSKALATVAKCLYSYA